MYTWRPGDRGLDELLVQYDWSRAPWWMVTDAGGDVVAMCQNPSSGSAPVAAQWTYDAYGAVINESVFVSGSPVNTCGHKGLFVERLDVGVIHAGVEAKRLAAGAGLYGHVRNRGYGFDTGRWFQADPNATGMVVAESAHHGATPLPVVDQFDVAARYGDGANLYEYLGSNTWIHSDQMGLYLGYDDLALAFVGGMRGGLEEMIGQYADNMLADAEWASDWDMDDDWHSRNDNKWVNLSFAMGFYRGMMEQVQDSLLIKELPDVTMGAGSGSARQGGRATLRMAYSARELNRVQIHASYSAAKHARQQAGLAGDSHHLVELQMDGPWRANMKGEGRAVNLEMGFHRSEIRIRFNRAYEAVEKRGFDRKNLPQAEAERVVKMVYHDALNLRNAALKSIRGK